MIVWDAPTGRPHILSLYTAIVVVLFGLRHNLPDDVIGELFGCSHETVGRYQDDLEPLIDMCLTPLYEEIRAQAHRDAALVDGFVAPVGGRDGVDDLHSGKKHINGQNVQVIGTLSGRLADVCDPCPGSMHDSRAFVESGIARRWAKHYEPDGPGLTGDKAYQGTGVYSPVKKPQSRDLTDIHRLCNTLDQQDTSGGRTDHRHLKVGKYSKQASDAHSTSSRQCYAP